MSTLERLGSMDRTWLQIESSANPMQVVGVLVLAKPLKRTALEECLRTRLLKLERFRQRVLPDSAGAIWESGPVNLDQHIVEVRLSTDNQKAALQSLVGELAAEPLDSRRPLWQVHFVRNYQRGCALVVRVHHCLADSIALIGVLRALTAPHPDEPEPVPLPSPPATYFDRLYAPLTRAMIDAIQLSGAFWARYWQLIFRPRQIFDYARNSTALALEIGKLSGLPDDSQTVLKGKPIGVKQVSWSKPLDQASIDAIAAIHGTNAPAVVLTALAGALGDYLTGGSASLAGVELRLLMPANLRCEETEEALGNRSGLVPIDLPVGIGERHQRLAEIHRRLDLVTRTDKAQATLGLLSLIGQTPPAVQQQALELLARKSSAVLCHAPGTPHARYLAGIKIVEEVFWSPPFGDIGVAISLVHYDGHYQVGVLADAAMLANPTRITEQIAAELLALAPPRKPARRAARK